MLTNLHYYDTTRILNAFQFHCISEFTFHLRLFGLIPNRLMQIEIQWQLGIISVVFPILLYQSFMSPSALKYWQATLVFSDDL